MPCGDHEGRTRHLAERFARIMAPRHRLDLPAQRPLSQSFGLGEHLLAEVCVQKCPVDEIAIDLALINGPDALRFDTAEQLAASVSRLRRVGPCRCAHQYELADA